MKVLEIKNLSIFYGDKKIIDDVNLDIEENEIICIMGSSGSGKSTLISSLNGFLSENKGSYLGKIALCGEDIENLDKLELRKRIATLFQDAKPFDFSIENNLIYVLEYYGGKVKDKDEKIRELLKKVNLYDEVEDKLKSSANNLSGGQKQRLCIARMLIAKPKVLIFDEPSSSLDEKNSIFIENLIKKLSKEYTIIISTHNEVQAKRLADRIIMIENSKLIEIKNS